MDDLREEEEEGKKKEASPGRQVLSLSKANV